MMWRVESKVFQFDRDNGNGSLLLIRLVKIIENMKLGDTEKVYIKYNGSNMIWDYCQFGILSEKPLTSCSRFTKIKRKRKYLYFTDKNIDLIKPINISPEFKLYKSPYKYKPGIEHVLGMIIYESPLSISIIENIGGVLEKYI